MEAAIVEGLAGVEADRTGQAALDQVGGRILVDLDRSQQFGGDVGEVQRLPADARRKGVAAVEFGADEVEAADDDARSLDRRSEEHTSELQSLMRISYAVFCLKKKNIKKSIMLKHRNTKSTTPTTI